MQTEKIFSDWRNGFVLRQNKINLGRSRPTLAFGPLEASLDELFEKGFYLYGEYRPSNNIYKSIIIIRLKRGRETYKVGKTNIEGIKGKELQELVTVKQVLRNYYVEDPLESLLSKYKKNKKVLVGNKTLDEILRS